MKLICSHIGCNNLVNKLGLCLEHRKSRFKGYTPRKPEDINPLYLTERWVNMRRNFLQRNRFCVCCKYFLNRETPSTDVDHIIPPGDDKKKFFSTKLQALCKSCHGKKTYFQVKDKYVTDYALNIVHRI